jgi:hypothetical protein
MTAHDEATIESFDDLAPLRRTGVDGLRANGWESGFRDLLADLYPDNAHFIYELLQNAEDAGAHEVTFDLRPDGLHVEHDGTRLFTLADIVSITGIGKSTKADDATSIGKFGVGFKSVFAYTQRPVIHSGEHSFEIVDLFVPERVESEARPALTTFWFPFDRPDKPAERAVAEVANALRDVSRSTLLFLSSIRAIACYFPDGDERLLERRAVDSHVVAIESAHEDDGPSYWYRATGDVAIGDKTLPVAAAFALEKRSDDSTESEPRETLATSAPLARRKRRSSRSEFVVRPTDGQVFIYFPAVKETSGLKFHIHAPFASTVARDSVRDDDGNDQLVAGIARLVADALPTMRDEGLVDDGLLSALPNNRDTVEERYTVVRDLVVDAFQTEALTPAGGGEGNHPSRKLIRSVSALRAALTPDDIDVLREISVGVGDNPASGWLPEHSGRPGAFFDSLAAIEFSGHELANVFERVGYLTSAILSSDEDYDLDETDLNDQRSWETWISAKDDPWLRAFYTALGRVAQNASPYDKFARSLAEAPIVRVRLGDGVTHVCGSEAYLPVSPGIMMDGLVVDVLVAFDDGASKAAKQEALALREFFVHANAQEWDAAAQLDAHFAEYDDAAEFSLDDHLQDLATLAQLLQEKAVSAGSYSNRAILRARDVDGNLTWRAPSRIFLDDPYGTTGLAALYESDAFAGRLRPQQLSDEYLGSSVDVAALARVLQAKHAVEITRTNVAGNAEYEWTWARNENYNAIRRDWTIADFEAIVATDDETLLCALWNVVAAAPRDRAEACYRANATRSPHVMPSQLLQKLTTIPWVLDRYGNRALPEDVSAADLDDRLIVPADSPLLVRSGFGRKAAANEKAQAEADDVARRWGFDSSEPLERLGVLCKGNPELLAEVMAQLEARLELPEGPSAAPERRAERAVAGAAAASPRRYEQRVRSVYVQEPGHLSAARGYLRRHYTNADGVMVCQICSMAMPFVIQGEYYFEAVQFVRDARRDLQENRLALCPTCAAKYRHAMSTTSGDLRDDLLTQDVGTRASITVDVNLAGRDLSIRFVGTHAIDLQAGLEAVDSSGLDGDEPDESWALEPES